MPDIQSFSQLVYHDIISHGLPIRGSSVVVAVSGGADSVATLHVLYELRGELQARLTVAHFDHAIRPQSESDAGFVRRLAEEMGLDFITRRSDTLEATSSEEAARDERRRFLSDAMSQSRSQRIITGHTADDRAETALFRVIRGTGTEGLSSIHWHRGDFVRPLLGRTHQQAVDYLTSIGQTWLEDKTNADPAFTRNYIRHNLLPVIQERLNPRASEALNRLADLATLDFDFIDSEADRLLKAAASISQYQVVLNCSVAKKEHPSVVWQTVRKSLQVLTGSCHDINFDMVQRVVRAVNNPSMGEDIGLGIHLDATDKELWLTKSDNLTEVARFCVNLKSEAISEIGNTGYSFITAETRHADADFYLRASLPVEQLVFRNWKPGDRIKPVGMTGTKKVQDVFVDAKLPRQSRSSLPLLANSETGEVLWVPGLCISRNATAGSSTFYTISLIRK